jgi:hypothetical protein
MADSSEAELIAAERAVGVRLAKWDVDTEDQATQVTGQGSIARTRRSRRKRNAAQKTIQKPSVCNRKGEQSSCRPLACLGEEHIAGRTRMPSAESVALLSRVLVQPRRHPKSASGETATTKFRKEGSFLNDIPSKPEEAVFGPSAPDKLTPKSAERARELSMSVFVDEHRREVTELGASGLSKRSRREYELRRRLEIGLRKPKGQNVPLRMLLGMRMKQREREAKEKEQARASGMLVRSKRGKRGKV